MPLYNAPGVLIEEVDGAPAARVNKIKVSNGTLSISADVATVDTSGSGVADILDLPTAETDDTLVLAPDGAGGVEFRAETGGGSGAPTTSEYVTTAADGGLSAEVVIPGLAGSADRRAGGGSDMEFDSSTIGGTALGSPTTIDADTTVQSNLYIAKAATSGFALAGRYWTAPSMPFTMTAKLADGTPAASANRMGIGIAESTPGKTEGIYLDCFANTVISTISSTTPSSGAAYVAQGGTYQLAQPPVYFRCVVASSTDITWYWSFSGHVWMLLGSANRNPSFTIATVWAAVSPENASVGTSATFDWIRFT